MSWLKRALLLGAGLLVAAAAGCSGEAAELTTIRIHFSRFEPGVIKVRAGEPVSFRLVNDDPIEHEWILGTPDVHERHRSGTEPLHDQVPTEVTVPAFSTRMTTVQFDRPGQYIFICHLPGHEAYGMRGELYVAAP